MSASAGPVSGRMDPSPVARIGANDLAAMASRPERKATWVDMPRAQRRWQRWLATGPGVLDTADDPEINNPDIDWPQ